MTSVTSMVLFIGYHTSSPKRRESIQAHGLAPHKPHALQPKGVYVFSDDIRHHLDRSLVEWSVGPGVDLWRIAYCGPMQIDDWTYNGVILGRVLDVTLVTGNE